MPPQNLAVPFLTRNMLAFQEGVAFSLKITTQSTSASSLTIRGLTKEGIFNFVHIPTNNSVIATESFRLSDVPIMVSVIDRDGTLGQGDVYVTLDLVANGDVLYNYFAGFVYRQKSMSWPSNGQLDMVPGGGKIASKTLADPAAGAEYSLTVPAGQIWRIISGRLKLVCDGTAANRRVHILFTNGQPDDQDFFHATDITAGLTARITFGSQGSSTAGPDNTVYNIMIPPNLTLIAGEVIKTQTTNLQAGDNFAAGSLVVEQFFTPV